MGQPSVGSRRPTLVGRELELIALNSLAQRASAGATQLAVISGDPGVGKTRLVAELVGRRTAAGWSALVGGADGLRATPPYGPFVEALRSLTDRPGAEPIAALAGDWTRHLSLVLPELGPPGRGADRGALPEAWAQVLRRVCAAEPTIVALDDLGWADSASLDLVLYLRRRLRDERLLIVATHAVEDAAPGGRLAPLLGELSRQRLAVHIELGPLTGDETAALADRLLGGPVSPRLARLVTAESEGNPFFAEELVRSLAEHGRLVTEHGRWDVVGDERTDLTPSARTVVSARLRPLEQEARRVLGVAAVLGRRSTAAEIAAVGDVDIRAVEELLADAVRRRLVVGDGDAYAFTHDRIRTLSSGNPDCIRT
jgi:predicted ATPase